MSKYNYKEEILRLFPDKRVPLFLALGVARCEGALTKALTYYAGEVPEVYTDFELNEIVNYLWDLSVVIQTLD